ncbi:peptidoglycan DD-metalloendopeptidase family protein [Streptomyces sp. NPDC003077]|uniref:peptidoglycan DD-metalloendopeptidase family protein n=1 Tax=Streptomyces sp. NPDC003077 TaxID=3154443 RepID=UPI0033AD35FA
MAVLLTAMPGGEVAAAGAARGPVPVRAGPSGDDGPQTGPTEEPVPARRSGLRRAGARRSGPLPMEAAAMGAGAVPPWGGAQPVARQGPGGRAGRLADVSLEVIRSAEAEARGERRYEEGARAARAQRVRTGRLLAALGRARREATRLWRSVGHLASARYRTGGPLRSVAGVLGDSHARAGVSSGVPAGVSSGASAGVPAGASAGRKAGTDRGRSTEQRGSGNTERQEQALAARLHGALRATQALAARSEAAGDRSAELDGRQGKLYAERSRTRRHLEEARERLRWLATEAAISGDCTGLPSATSAVAARHAPMPATGTRWVTPVERYTLSAPFGGTGARWASTHTGQDFAVPVGTSVRAVGEGRVIRVTCGDAFGISMVVRHADGVYSQYAHLSAALVAPGQRVRSGRRIALSGDTGNSTGPHLHFEVRRTPDLGSAVDPVPWLRQRGVVV